MDAPPLPATGRPRPRLFRALGDAEPPDFITVDGQVFRRDDVLKHDSWAATAIYSSSSARIICKFNRRQSILGIPMRWLGRRLARREAHFYRTLADLPVIAPPCGPVHADGQVLDNAVAHYYVEGAPMRQHDRLPEKFFAELTAALAEVHRRGVVYMDLHKRENIIVAADGKPYLIDFQVSLAFPPRTWFVPAAWLRDLLQSGDRYHLLKHELRNGVRTRAERDLLIQQAQPWWIRVHRVFAQPLRAARRRLLVLLGIRRDRGRAQTEHFTEDGLRAGSSRAA